MNGEDLDNYLESDTFNKIFKEFDYMNNGTIDQKDAYFWAYKMAGEDFEGIVSANM